MNSVCIVGNLTRDPELRHTPGGTALCKMGVAVNDRKKDGDEWVDVPYFFDVVAWGPLGERCAQYLAKGKKVAVNGKLTWRSWEAQDGSKRSAVEIHAFGVDFLTPRSEGDSQGGFGSGGQQASGGSFGDAPIDDDIPF